MSHILTATVPVFLLIMLGSALAYRKIVGGDAWKSLQQLNYFIFIPAMFLSGLARAEFSAAPVALIVVSTAVVLGLGTAFVWLWRSRVPGGLDLAPQLLEGTIRANVPYGMGLSFALGGDEGLSLFLVAAAAYLPCAILAGGVMAQMAGRRHANPEAEQQYALVSALRMLAQNPIVIGVVIGVILNITALPLAPGLSAAAETAGYAAIPVGLLGAGAALSVAAAQNALDAARRDVVVALSVKLVALPLLGGLAAFLLGLDAPAAVAVVLIAALPCVVPRFTVATGMSASVLGGIATLATLLSAATLPLALWLLT